MRTESFFNPGPGAGFTDRLVISDFMRDGLDGFVASLLRCHIPLPAEDTGSYGILNTTRFVIPTRLAHLVLTLFDLFTTPAKGPELIVSSLRHQLACGDAPTNFEDVEALRRIIIFISCKNTCDTFPNCGTGLRCSHNYNADTAEGFFPTYVRIVAMTEQVDAIRDMLSRYSMVSADPELPEWLCPAGGNYHQLLSRCDSPPELAALFRITLLDYFHRIPTPDSNHTVDDERLIRLVIPVTHGSLAWDFLGLLFGYQDAAPVSLLDYEKCFAASHGTTRNPPHIDDMLRLHVVHRWLALCLDLAQGFGSSQVLPEYAKTAAEDVFSDP